MQPMHPVINSNIKNFCSPKKYPNCHITRINPDKSTFLNSNLLVSNILNHLSPKREQITEPLFDAYENKDHQMKKNKEESIDKKERIERVKNLAKCRSQTALEQKYMKQKEVQRQVQQIHIMCLEMNEKARDIMSRKEDTAYLGRNIFLEGEKFLKQMKDSNPNDKVVKIEATRMLMKEGAKKRGRIGKVSQNNLQDASQLGSHDLSCSGTQNNTLNMSVQVSTDTILKKDPRTTGKQKDKKMVTLIKNKSFDCVFKQQKRLAAWQGFTQNWAQGFAKQEDVISTKKKRRTRRSPKQKYVDVSDDGLLDYHDKFTRHVALKKYNETFTETAASFKILSH